MVKKKPSKIKTYFLPRRIPDKMIKYVEKSEKKKFKRKPTLHYAEMIGTNATHESTTSGDKVKSAKITMGLHVLSTNKKKPFTNKGKVVLLHELRENLYIQNNPKSRSIKTAKNPYHKKANTHRTRDSSNVRKGLI